MPALFQSYAARSATPLALLDGKGQLAFANDAFRRILPACSAGQEGFGIRETGLPAQDARELEHALARVLRTGVEMRLPLGAGSENGCMENPSSDLPSPSVSACRLIPHAGSDLVVLELEPARKSSPLLKTLRNERVLRHQAEMLRSRSRQLFLNVINELPIFVYMQRKDYSVAFANKKTLAFYGEIDGRKCYEVFGGRNDPCPHCPTFRVFDTDEPVDWQFTDDAGRTFHIYDYPFEDENGEPLVMELGVDITELKRVERELFQAQKMRAIGVLAGGIAHDLNNNLVPIIFNIDYALGKAGETAMDEPLAEALKAAYKAADLVEQVLEYSRQQEVTRSPLRLTPLAKDNLGLLQASLPDHVTLRTNYSAENDCVLANPSQIQQILLNLCRNAVQAMPEGGTLSVDLANLRLDSQQNAPHAGLALGEHVVMTVTDTGRGMEPEVVERIFEPFYTSKKKSGGTGMGLAVVHAIITCNGGSIHVDSAPGKGTTFTVYFPCCANPEVKTLERETRHDARASGRLLLVDDDAGALQAMKRVLRDAGYEVATADSGGEGLKEYFRARGRFDIVITDQSMPGMTGMEMAARILEHDPEAKVVICTGHVEPRLEVQAGEMGVVGFFMKPMTPRALVENVSRICA